MASADELRARVQQRADSIEPDLVGKALRAEELRAAYQHQSLEIEVPYLAVLITAQFHLLGNTREWNPSSGLVVQRGFVRGRTADGTSLPDMEALSNDQLLAAGRPDVDYVWFVDWVRAAQQLWNLIAGLVGYSKLPLLDRWGTLFYQLKGGPSLTLELVNRPQYVADLLIRYAATLASGTKAESDLVVREDARRQRGIR